jgi:hypothetical protein
MEGFPMKCIKLSDNAIQRLKDKEAFKLVSSNQAVFVLKTEWKKADPKHPERAATQKKIDDAILAKKNKPAEPIL